MNANASPDISGAADHVVIVDANTSRYAGMNPVAIAVFCAAGISDHPVVNAAVLMNDAGGKLSLKEDDIRMLMICPGLSTRYAHQYTYRFGEMNAL